jgi:PBP4 family serine-type D-alanyl-D-alanine carboxypeptidase
MPIRNKNIIFFLFLIFSNLIFAQAVKQPNYKYYSAVSILQEQINEILQDINFANSNIGIYVKSLDNGDILYSYNKDKLFHLASCTKIFTSVAAFEYLGDKFQYNTEVYYDGKLLNSILKGNLYIVGSGDPTLKTQITQNKTIYDIFWDSLDYNDITEITGNIIADDSYFDNKYYPESWLFDYENKWFSPPSSALSLDNNLANLIVIPTRQDQKAKVVTEPSNVYLSIINNVKTISGKSNNITTKRLRASNVIVVNGTIGQYSDSLYYQIPINNPTQSFVVNLRDKLIKSGIKIKGNATNITDENLNPDYDKLELLFTIKSSPLYNILREMNKNSDNFIAEQVLKTIGAEIVSSGSTDAGLHVINELITKAGISSNNISLKDGSGLSPYSMATPFAVVDFLSYVSKQEYFDKFLSTLPIMGIDGTLIDRMKGYSYKGKIIAKPGFSYGTNTLAGYIITNEGEKLAFAIFINNFLGYNLLATKLQDEICFKLVNFSRKY